MVRGFTACLLAAFSMISCGIAGRPGGGSEIPGPCGEAADETVQGEHDEPDRALNDFTTAQYFAENPVDPVGAEIEELLSIPGFSEDLARRIIAVAGERAAARDWVERLTPEERRELRRHRDSMAPTERHSVRAICRLTERSIARAGEERSDAYAALIGDRWKALCRAQRTDGVPNAFSWYLSGNVVSETMRLHAGGFVPDYAFGLVFGGSGGASLSSGAFPFHSARRIGGTTSFFRRTLYGGGAEIRFRDVYAAVFGGWPVTYGSGGPLVETRRIAGARIEALRGRAEFGLSGSSGASESGRAVWAIDGRWRSERLNAGLEIGCDGAGDAALLSGFSYRAPKARMGLLLYTVPPRTAGIFGMVNGREPGKTSSFGGAAALLEHAMPRRILARATIDRYGRADGSRATLRHTTRIGCERSSGRFRWRISLSGSMEEKQMLLPCPPESSCDRKSSRAIALHSEWRPGGATSIGVALKRIDEARGMGWLFAPVVRTSLLSNRLRTTAAVAVYRTARGRAECCYYEPALRGAFPLHIVSEDAERSVFLISYNNSILSASLHVTLEDGRLPEFSLQASVDL